MGVHVPLNTMGIETLGEDHELTSKNRLGIILGPPSEVSISRYLSRMNSVLVEGSVRIMLDDGS